MSGDGWVTLRELDVAARRPKGAAFRAFKALAPGLEEGRDFVVRDGAAEPALAARAWPGSARLILLSAATAARVRAALR